MTDKLAAFSCLCSMPDTDEAGSCVSCFLILFFFPSTCSRHPPDPSSVKFSVPLQAKEAVQQFLADAAGDANVTDKIPSSNII